MKVRLISLALAIGMVLVACSGCAGAQGERGEQGIQGERGEQGIQGERGEQGIQGERGEQGIQGERGEQGEIGVGVTSAYIDDACHLIVTLTDGTVIDAGYVGAKVTPSAPLSTYIVTFMDWDGTVLQQQPDVTENGAATAPADPVREGYAFAGWDQAFDAITANTVITATYRPVYTPSDGLEYTLSYYENSYEVVGIGTCTDTVIGIPFEYEGLPVDAIQYYAFADCTAISTVYIPASVKEIQEYAFYGCTALTRVILEDTENWNTAMAKISPSLLQNAEDLATNLAANAIGDAMEKCELQYEPDYYADTGYVVSLLHSAYYHGTELTVPAEYGGEPVTGVYYEGFAYCPDLETIVLPEGMRAIDESAFYCCPKLKQVVLPQSLQTIAYGAFDSCTALETLTIPQNVTFIDEYAFANCTALCSVRLENPTAWFTSAAFTEAQMQDTALMAQYLADTYCDSKWHHFTLLYTLNRKGTGYIVSTDTPWSFDRSLLTSITVPSSHNGLPVVAIDEYAFHTCSGITEWQLPNSVTSIKEGAFYACSSLQSIRLPNGLSRIESSVFSDCSALCSVTIPVSVTYIGAQAFSSCKQLRDIYYEGTVEEWKTVQKVRGSLAWDSESGAYVVHCTDGDLTK